MAHTVIAFDAPPDAFGIDYEVTDLMLTTDRIIAHLDAEIEAERRDIELTIARLQRRLDQAAGVRAS